MATRDGGTEPVPLDDIDRSIISELTRDGRMSVTQVAENVHISRAHAYTRIGRLTSEGVLSRFTALVDPIKAGLRSSAYVTLKLKQDAFAGEPADPRVRMRPRNMDVLRHLRDGHPAVPGQLRDDPAVDLVQRDRLSPCLPGCHSLRGPCP